MVVVLKIICNKDKTIRIILLCRLPSISHCLAFYRNRSNCPVEVEAKFPFGGVKRVKMVFTT